MADDPMTQSRRLPQDVADRLLARAAELDQAGADRIPLTQLRAAAQEAGISTAAFDAALAEVLARKDVVAAPPRRPAFLDRWTRRLAPSALSIAAVVSLLTVTVALVGMGDVVWLVRKAIDPLVFGAGAAIAFRLRARPVGLLFTGLSVALGAEFLMDAATGVPAVRGAGAHFALMIAGIGGVVIGALTKRGRAGDAGAPAAAELPHEAARAMNRDSHEGRSFHRVGTPAPAG